MVLNLEPQLKGDGDNKVRIRRNGLFHAAIAKKMGPILHFVAPNFVQARFGLKHCDRRLKFCMQHLDVIIHTNQEYNLGLEVNDLHYDFHQIKIIHFNMTRQF